MTLANKGKTRIARKDDDVYWRSVVCDGDPISIGFKLFVVICDDGRKSTTKDAKGNSAGPIVEERFDFPASRNRSNKTGEKSHSHRAQDKNYYAKWE